MKLLVACVAVLLAALAATAGPARACSCVTPDPRTWLPRVDGAIVGTLVSRRVDGDQAVHLFRVLEAVKGRFGSTVEVTSHSSGATCGLELRVGQTTGLLLDRREGRWTSGLCWQVDAVLLRAAARPLPPPNGRGPAALLLAGRFGPARSLALDSRGRTLGYGRGRLAVTAFGVCPGSRRVVELSAGRSGTLQVRRLPDLRLLARRRLAAGGGSNIDVSCRSADGSKVALFLTQPFASGAGSRVLVVDGMRTRVLWRGRARHGRVGRNVAVVAADDGGRLVRVSLATGRATTLARVPPVVSGLWLGPEGGAVAALGWRRLSVVSTRGGRPLVRSTRVCCGGAVAWLPNSRLVLAGRSGTLRIFDPRLRELRRVAGWNAHVAAHAGGRIFGAGWNGRLRSVPVWRGGIATLGALPGVYVRLLAAVPPS